jgi:hypothetical protein
MELSRNNRCAIWNCFENNQNFISLRAFVQILVDRFWKYYENQKISDWKIEQHHHYFSMDNAASIEMELEVPSDKITIVSVSLILLNGENELNFLLGFDCSCRERPLIYREQRIVY